MNEKFDIVCIGGGLSSLLFLNYIKNIYPEKKIIVLEKNKNTRADQTLCAWVGSEIPNIETMHAIKPKKEWKKIKIESTTNHCILNIEPYSYVAYESKTLLNALIKKLGKNIKYQSNFDVKKVIPGNIFKIISKDGNIIQSEFVIDSRPLVNKSSFKNKENLFQAFIGEEIKVDQDLFDEDKVTLMNFKENNEAIEFTYVLPFSKREALVETTFFAQEVNWQSIRKSHEITMKKYGRYKKLRLEKAILPMGIINSTMDEGMLKIGSNAGMIRPSTGYSMQRVIHWIKSLEKQSVGEFKTQDYFYKSPAILDWMDKIFLRACYYDPKIGPRLFLSFFKTGNIGSVIRFMSDQPSLGDIFRIIWALPKWPMIKSIFSNHANR